MKDVITREDLVEVKISDIANPNCKICYGTGVVGHINVVRDKEGNIISQDPVLCQAKHCSAQAVRLAAVLKNFVKRNKDDDKEGS
jgi:hypothetical protein